MHALIVLLAFAQDPWTPEDLVMQESASGFEISPDGRWAVWVKRTADKEKNEFFSHLFLSGLGEKAEIQLTRGFHSHGSPKFSPDGKRVAFLSMRPLPKPKEEETSQLWLLDLRGGEPWPLTEGDRAVAAFEWIDDHTILFSAQEESTHLEKRLKDEKDATLVVDDEPHAPPVRLYKVAIEDKKVTRVSDNEDRIGDFASHGAKVVALHERSLRYVYDGRVKPVTVLHDLETGKRTPIDWKLNPSRFEWTPDGKGFYVSSEYTSHATYLMATVRHLYYYEDGKLLRVNLEWDNGIEDFRVTADGFLALLANGVRHKLARYTRRGDKWTREGIDASNVFEIEVEGDTVVYRHTKADLPDQWYRAKLDGAKLVEPTAFTELNGGLKERTFAKTEVIRWKGAKDEEVEGILYYPHGYEKGKKYALVVMIHGGPMGADFDAWDDSWAYPANLFCQRGAFVLKPNYHGSSNYGLKFVESISNGQYYDLELPDIERGVDHLIAQRLVDPDRLGVMGWSNGSILTIGLTVSTTRYKAASAGAGDVDWVSDWGNCEFGAAFDNYYLGGTPLERPDTYYKKSPFWKLGNVKTPTIIFFGTEDRAVPTQQGWMHYRALQQLGRTDVRFVLFPGEPHSIGKPAFQKRKLEEELAWFDKHLFKTAKAESEALKKDSPLALRLRAQSFSKAGRSYGETVKDVLVPETVMHKKLRIGRFEVTRAQFAAFDAEYKYDAGAENWPANGITFDQAKAYCDWLSKHTGEMWRLGTEEELKDLYDVEGGNTLDHWAGYDVNPDDAARLAPEIKKLDLLSEVGRFDCTDEKLFDLGGNVSEWCAEGRLLGAGADSPADAKARERSAAPEYRGFRVVRGAP